MSGYLTSREVDCCDVIDDHQANYRSGRWAESSGDRLDSRVGMIEYTKLPTTRGFRTEEIYERKRKERRKKLSRIPIWMRMTIKASNR